MAHPPRIKIGYHFALRWARLKRSVYVRRLAWIASRPVTCAEDTPVSYYAFSGTRDLAEQVASLRSFLSTALNPRKVVVVGDGTHTASDVAILRALHPRLETMAWDAFVRRDLPARMLEYAGAHPLGKKVAVLMSVPEEGPWIFSDSDILYFPSAADIRDRVRGQGSGLMFLEDCYPSLDDRLLRRPEEKASPVNSGFAIVFGGLDWSVALGRLAEMCGDPGYFTEQTLFHLATHASGGRALPSDRYVIRSDDQWVGRDLHSGPGVVLRHYFSSIRYKMWLKVRFPK